MQESGTDVDVICLSEHFIKKDDEKYMVINNFQLSAIYTRSDQRRGGTCILTKNNVQFIELDYIKELSIEKQYEVCAIEIKKMHLIILCIYRTPSSNLNIFFDHFDKTLLQLQRKKCRVVIAGDFNFFFSGKRS